jgi:hypothetical protein
MTARLPLLSVLRARCALQTSVVTAILGVTKIIWSSKMRIILFSLMFAMAAATLPLQSAVAAGTEIHLSTVKPDLDFSKYGKFMILPLDMGETVIIPPPWAEGSAAHPRPWKIKDKNLTFLNAQYRDAMKTQLQEKGGYALVDEAGDDVLAVEIEIISLTPWAERGEKVITMGSGEMTFRAELRDSMTRDLLVIYEGDTPVGKDYQENTDFSVQQNVNALFNEWGEYLRLALDAQKAAAEQ